MIDKEFHELLLERHSIRKYTDQPIDPADVRTILEAALLAPSSKSQRPWQFVVVEDPETLQKMSACKKFGSISLKFAKMAVVVLTNPEKSDMFIEDAAVAAQQMQLQAAALGIGSCWVQIRNRVNADDQPAQDIIQQLLDIPSHLIVECVMTFGYSAEKRRPVDPEKLQWEKVFIGKWEDRGL